MNKSKAKQIHFNLTGVKPEKSEHGGSLKNPQKRKRPLGLRSTMHMTLRSSKAVKKWSFQRHESAVTKILKNFAQKYHIELLMMANVGNHIHLQLRPTDRKNYRAFIRAATAAIMMRVTGYNRWNKAPNQFQFWDQRPFSRIINSWKDYLNVKKYIQINQWEARGLLRPMARNWVENGFFVPATKAIQISSG